MIQSRNRGVLYGLKGTTCLAEKKHKKKRIGGDSVARREQCCNCTKPASECKGNCFDKKKSDE